VDKLCEPRFETTLQDKMPDVMLCRFDKNWICFVKPVASVDSMDSKNIMKIEEMPANIKIGKYM